MRMLFKLEKIICRIGGEFSWQKEHLLKVASFSGDSGN
jgi:hypothetical protein